jgi:Fe-S-cluster containining protein
LNQLLTPYDILRLKNHLEISSGEFLRNYTSRHTGPESGLPIVTLKPRDLQKLTCPFVSENGCRVYENRPSSCRTYPLMRAVTRSRSTAEMIAQFMLLRESHCLGFEADKTRTLQQWIDDQGIAVYNENNDKLMQIISLKNRRIPGPLDIKSSRLFFTALYDLDKFKWQIQHSGLLDNLKINSGIIDTAVENDVALLDLALIWIEHALSNR